MLVLSGGTIVGMRAAGREADASRRPRGGWRGAAVAMVAIAALVPSATAGAAASKRPLVSAVIPAAVGTSDSVRIRGRVAGAKLPAAVALEQRSGRRWIVLARGRAKGSAGDYSLRWRAPAKRGVVTLRVVEQGKRGASASQRVAVAPVTVLQPAKVTQAPPAGAPGELRYQGRPAVRGGEFLALDIGPQTPYGLLARITSVRREGEQTVLQTQPASLIEILPEGRIDVGAPTAGAAAEPGKPEEKRGFGASFDCSGETKADLKGALSVGLEPRFKLNWSFFKVRSLEASATLKGEAELSAHVSGAGSCTFKEKSLATWDAPSIKFSIGYIPVVIVPRLNLFVSGAAAVSGTFDTGVAGYLSATAGLRYDKNGVSPIGAFDHKFTYTAPTTRIDAGVGVRVDPAITFLLYGVVGPRFDLNTGLQLDAKAFQSPWWTLSLPVELRASLSVPNFPQFDTDPRVVFSKSFVLATAPLDPAPAPAPDPAPSPGPGSKLAADGHPCEECPLDPDCQ